MSRTPPRPTSADFFPEGRNAPRQDFRVPRIGVERSLRSRLLAPVKHGLVIPLTLLLRRRPISRYLAVEADPRVHVGCGPHRIPGWLNTDVHRQALLNRDGLVYLDMRRKLPFPDGQIAFLFVEHAVYQLRLDEAVRFFAECRRVLRPGGVLRIGEANLEFMVNVYRGKHPQSEKFIRFITDGCHGNSYYSACIVVNTWFLNRGTKFRYDPETLGWVLGLAGFDKIERVRIGESSHPELCGIEGHGKAMPPELNEVETFVLEATQ